MFINEHATINPHMNVPSDVPEGDTVLWKESTTLTIAIFCPGLGVTFEKAKVWDKT
ncbi:MAG: hypothetical protein CM15mP71_1050 [Candidatus Poseidoniales archaeon]|nr:MAG: hypothetical protein CM15mP71_1050 [Candidatus Poseidoniales archaeon]